jgi:hypothetical protein
MMHVLVADDRWSYPLSLHDIPNAKFTFYLGENLSKLTSDIDNRVAPFDGRSTVDMAMLSVNYTCVLAQLLMVLPLTKIHILRRHEAEEDFDILQFAMSIEEKNPLAIYDRVKTHSFPTDWGSDRIILAVLAKS